MVAYLREDRGMPLERIAAGWEDPGRALPRTGIGQANRESRLAGTPTPG
jgi:hypothetical protein